MLRIFPRASTSLGWTWLSHLGPFSLILSSICLTSTFLQMSLLVSFYSYSFKLLFISLMFVNFQLLGLWLSAQLVGLFYLFVILDLQATPCWLGSLKYALLCHFLLNQSLYLTYSLSSTSCMFLYHIIALSLIYEIFQSSFARYMSNQGFDTWILEVRGAGLSVQGSKSKEIKQSAYERSEQMEATSRSATNGTFPVEVQSTIPDALEESETFAVKGEESESVVVEDMMGIATVWDESRLVMKLTETFMRLSERLSGFLTEGQSKIMYAKFFDQISKLLVDSQLSERFNEIREKLSNLLETRQNSSIANQITDLSQRIVNIIEEGQRSVSPPLFDLQERLASTIEDFQKQLDLIVKYDWDFDHYLEEDVPAAVR